MASPSPSELVHVFFHEGMLNHNIGTGVFDTLNNPGFLEILDKHPENPDRVKNMVSILKRGPISPHMAWHQGRPAQTLESLSFHTPEYVNELVKEDKDGGKEFCAGTILNPSSWDVVLIAAGTTLSTMKHIIDGYGKIAYSSVRPPGRHAQPSRADGYCFINNAGLAVQLASDSCCERVVVIDIDVHYGNGTAEGFYRTDKVLTISLHMNHGSWGPSYLQSGTVDELGEGEGYGFNLNVMLPNGTGDRGYNYAVDELVIPTAQKFKPTMLVFVIGQDSSAMSSMAMQLDISNLQRECQEKDTIINRLTTVVNASEVAGSKRIAELEDVIKSKNMIITKMKKDKIVLEQQVRNLTMLKRASSTTATTRQLPVMTYNPLYDMDSSSASSSSDSDSDSKHEVKIPVAHEDHNICLKENDSEVKKSHSSISEKTPTAPPKPAMRTPTRQSLSSLRENTNNQRPYSASALRPKQSSSANAIAKGNGRNVLRGQKEVTPLRRWT